MRYLGGKHKLAKWIVGHLHRLDAEHGGRGFLDLFTGSGAIVAALRPDRVRVACDANRALITMHRHVQAGWLPGPIDRATYERLRAEQNADDPLTAAAGFGCAFGGIWFGSYVPGGERRRVTFTCGRAPKMMQVAPADVALRASLARIAPKIAGVHFYACDHRTIGVPPAGVVVYADPPYQGTTGYGAVGAFDHGAFWAQMRTWRAAGVVVLVSEFSAPEDWTEIDRRERGNSVRNDGRTHVERLYM